MRKKILALSLVFLAFSSFAVAQQTEINQEEVGTGFFGPDSMLYNVQLTMDDVMLDEEEYMVRRAVETREMIDQDKPEAAERSVNELNRNVHSASEAQENGLETASSVLEDLDVPEEAEQGISTAVENIEEAGERAPEDAVENGMNEEPEEVEIMPVEPEQGR